MIIRRIALKNIKSYKEAEINLLEGITGISGLNGSGKSTILESIGYALFDCLPYTQAEFVRKGEKTGEITVEIIGADGCEYTVSRKCGSSQTYMLTDSLGTSYSGKDDVGDKLCEILGYRAPGFEQLSSLFENAIGVLQGTFVSEFLESPAKRKAIFDPLLRIDEYGIAFKNLATLKTLVKERIEKMENDKRYLEGRISQKDTLAEEQARINKDREELLSKTAEKKKLSVGLKAKKEELDGLEKIIQGLEARQRVISAEVSGGKREVESVTTRLQACETAIGKMRASEPGFKAYMAKNAEKEKLEKKRIERDSLLTSINLITNAVTELKAKANANDTALQELAEAEKNIPDVIKKVSSLEKLEEERQKVMSTIKALDMEKSQIRDRMIKAGSSKGNACPLLLNIECQSVKDFSAYFAGQLERIESEKMKHESRKASLDFEITGLNNPRVTLGVYQDKLKKKEALLAAKEKIKSDSDSKTGESMGLLIRLKEFEQLESRIKHVNEEIKTHRQAYDVYQQNVNISEQKVTLLKMLEQATQSLDKNQKDLLEVNAQIAGKKQSYNGDVHAKTKVEYEEVSREIASMTERADGITKRLVVIAENLKRIADDLQKIEELRLKQGVETDYLNFVDLSRNIIRQAGPEIVKVYIELISREATRMYGEIAGDRRIDIRWTADYDIVLIEEGRERSFKQLSGGEQMSAALAVRLAILKILTNSDVVFLDEPTQNMDENRRQNLAMEIMRIKDFRQMVVISHDDTFNANLENVVEIEKVNGESKVRGSQLA